MPDSSVRIQRAPVVFPTYTPAAPQKNPLFLENRVYQGSSGRVYPLPVIDRIAEHPVDRAWDAVHLENDFLRVMILPEIGGRIHVAQDKTNGYDLIYRQRAIKPALVGLAGPWLSGGIEFNWPQHHRPATFMPVDVEIEEHADGSKTVWLSDHDPMLRMKGMHGVCLHPGRAVIELKVRAYNRTPLPQTFLWWANVATQVHEGYQSFFPPDVHYVADHAKRAMSAYPLCEGTYYGVNYGTRPQHGVPPNEHPTQFVPPWVKDENDRKDAKRGSDIRAGMAEDASQDRSATAPSYAPNDLSWYANIPVPTSYMAMGSREDFFGGYDHLCRAGIVHIADHHISPGKKQWTWGNSAFGYAWDCNLTTPDENGVYPPYIEIMAGVYTDNQPDFSFLAPGETKTWSQYWYPIREIGPATHANLEAAVSIRKSPTGTSGSTCRIGVAVTRPHDASRIIVEGRGRTFHDETLTIAPDRPHVFDLRLPRGITVSDLSVTVRECRAESSASPQRSSFGKPAEDKMAGRPDPAADSSSRILLCYTPRSQSNGTEPPAAAPAFPRRDRGVSPLPSRAGRPGHPVPPPATEPAAPREIASADQLYLTGLHLDQYRHATRKPELYWREALRRDPGDARCNTALGGWHLRRGEFDAAEQHLRTAIGRLTERNPNPTEGESYYLLGLTLRYLSRDDDAYDAFYKATWNQAWQSAAYHALAEIDCTRGDWPAALDHLDRSLRTNTDHLRARDLKAMVLQRLGHHEEATSLVRSTVSLDRLDWWARWLNGDTLDCDTQTRLDLAHDLARAGFFSEAIALLSSVPPTPMRGSARESGDRTTPPAAPAFALTSEATQNAGTAPLVAYTAAWLCARRDAVALANATRTSRSTRRQQSADTRVWLKRAAAASPDYCFPARLEELVILQWAITVNPRDGRAPFYLGNLLYDRRRYDEAITCWETSARLLPRYSVVWRNLGIAYFNVRQQARRARRAYDRAFQANPRDARLLFERDQLWKRIGVEPKPRRRALEKHRALVRERDDLTIELCSLYNQTDQPAPAAALLAGRRFQPWEGGEGQALAQHGRAHLALGRAALARGDAAEAKRLFEAALATPENLGEARHPLANASDIHFWLGEACAALGDAAGAREHWIAAATFSGDFQEMAVRAYSEMTYYSALAWARLGEARRSRKLLTELRAYARRLARTDAKVDYFATSLPTMLLFNDDLQARQQTTALFLEAQAELGLGNRRGARQKLQTVLRRDPNHAAAADLLGELPKSKSTIEPRIL
jgi:tetratricopeptide (TPR) repeat protein